MRIIGGKYRGRKLAEFKGREIRPTSDLSLIHISTVVILSLKVTEFSFAQ